MIHPPMMMATTLADKRTSVTGFKPNCTSTGYNGGMTLPMLLNNQQPPRERRVVRILKGARTMAEPERAQSG